MSLPAFRLIRRRANPELVRKIKHITMLDDADFKPYLTFFLFLAMSAVIATCGIAAQSTAVVIGAMLISPLMSPIIGVSFAITVGEPKKAVQSFLVSMLGTAVVVGVAAIVSQVVPSSAPLLENTEVVSRISPRLVDLFSAIACGVVAACAIGRDDVFGTLPGVSISISLVPPLCVAGAALAVGAYPAALGALLLFSVNFFSIQLSCNFVFLLSGFAKHSHDEETSRMRAVWYGTALIGTLLLAAPLAATSNSLVVHETLQEGASEAVAAWVHDQPYDIISVDASPDAVVVEIAGDEHIPSLGDLRDLLREHGVEADNVKVRVIRQYE